MPESPRNGNNSSIVKVGAGGAGFLAKYAGEDNSTKGMESYIVIPRAKVVQGTTAKALRDKFPEGNVILRPADLVVARPNEAFMFVPLFFNVEFLKFSDRRDTGESTIAARSFDPASEIARRSRNPDLRNEVYEGHVKKKAEDQWKYRYVESLNFSGVLYGDHEMAGQELAVSFMRGEFGTGRNFCSAIQMRKLEHEDGTKTQLPLWSQTWMLTPKYREKTENKWWGLDFEVGEPAVILESDGDKFYARHLALAKAFEERRLVIDHADAEEGNDGGGEKAEM